MREKKLNLLQNIANSLKVLSIPSSHICLSLIYNYVFFILLVISFPVYVYVFLKFVLLFFLSSASMPPLNLYLFVCKHNDLRE